MLIRIRYRFKGQEKMSIIVKYIILFSEKTELIEKFYKVAANYSSESLYRIIRIITTLRLFELSFG